MTSTPSALLAAILADPDDELARFALADWLEEGGHPLAFKMRLPGVWRMSFADPRAAWLRQDSLYWEARPDPDMTTASPHAGYVPRLECQSMAFMTNGCRERVAIWHAGVWACLRCAAHQARIDAQIRRGQS